MCWFLFKYSGSVTLCWCCCYINPTLYASTCTFTYKTTHIYSIHSGRGRRIIISRAFAYSPPATSSARSRALCVCSSSRQATRCERANIARQWEISLRDLHLHVRRRGSRVCVSMSRLAESCVVRTVRAVWVLFCVQYYMELYLHVCVQDVCTLIQNIIYLLTILNISQQFVKLFFVLL